MSKKDILHLLTNCYNQDYHGHNIIWWAKPLWQVYCQETISFTAGGAIETMASAGAHIWQMENWNKRNQTQIHMDTAETGPETEIFKFCTPAHFNTHKTSF